VIADQELWSLSGRPYLLNVKSVTVFSEFIGIGINFESAEIAPNGLTTQHITAEDK